MGILADTVEGDIGAAPHCATCGSERVVKDAWACWNPETGLWELEQVLDAAWCHACEDNVALEWRRLKEPGRQRIAELNDAFRTKHEGTGTVLVTAGLKAKGETFLAAAIAAVRSFNTFTKDNDPWGEHDFGAVEIEGERVFWKIDAYNPDCTAGSEDPANPGVTHRVLTSMLAAP